MTLCFSALRRLHILHDLRLVPLRRPHLAEKIRRGVEELAIPHEKSPVAGVVTVSIGVAAIVPMRDSEGSLLLVAADRALYQAKTAGRNQVRSAGVFLN